MKKEITKESFEYVAKFARETVIVQKRNKLNVAIVKKFGSVAAFANHSENPLRPWTVIRVLKGEKKRDVEDILDQIAVVVEMIETDERKITREQRERARCVILIQYGSAAEFNRAFPQFPRPFISKVINGKKTFFDTRTREFFEEIRKLDKSQNQ